MSSSTLNNPNTPNSPSARFFIGVLLPELISNLIDHWRAQWYPYGLKTVPPHITLVPPFQANPQDDPMWQQITQPLSLTDTLSVHLNNIGVFPGTGVLFVRVDDSKLLDSAHQQLESRLTGMLPTFKKSQRPFRPHITIANRLKAHQSQEIQQLLQNQSLNNWIQVKEATIFIKNPEGPYQKFAAISLDK